MRPISLRKSTSFVEVRLVIPVSLELLMAVVGYKKNWEMNKRAGNWKNDDRTGKFSFQLPLSQRLYLTHSRNWTALSWYRRFPDKLRLVRLRKKASLGYGKSQSDDLKPTHPRAGYSRDGWGQVLTREELVTSPHLGGGRSYFSINSPFLGLVFVEPRQ